MFDFAKNYLIYRLFVWKSEYLSQPIESVDFTRVELMKLIFFVSAIKRNNESGDSDLLGVFNGFYAMTLGPVEISIYLDLLEGRIPCCRIIDEKRVRLNVLYHTDHSIAGENQSIAFDIDESVEKLKQTNPNIIGFNAARLVEISHLWRCWIAAMNIAKLLGKSSYRMNSQSIRNSNQFFGV